jgi:branched-chain amino acid transport system substrate-binding protein
MNMKKAFYLLLAVFGVFLLFNLGKIIKVLDKNNLAWFYISEPDYAKRRAKRAEKTKGRIVIGATGSWNLEKDKPVLQGIELAVDEINSAGGLLGREVELIVKSDMGDENIGEAIAQEFCSNLDMVAVIGHTDSSISRSTAVLYDTGGLVMITPFSTTRKLMPDKYRGFIFMNIPDNRKAARLLMKYMRAAGRRNLIIFSDVDEYSSDMGDAVQEQAHVIGLDIIERSLFDYTCNKVYFARKLAEIKRLYSDAFDSILVIGQPDKAAMIMEAASEVGIDVPFYGTDTIFNKAFIDAAGEKAEGMTVCWYDMDRGSPDAVEKFRRDFKSKYGYGPEDSAMMGYDTMMVLADAIEKAGSTVPAKIAETLRENTYIGLFGPTKFDAGGELIQDRAALFKMKDGRFVQIVAAPDGEKERGDKKAP